MWYRISQQHGGLPGKKSTGIYCSYEAAEYHLQELIGLLKSIVGEEQGMREVEDISDWVSKVQICVLHFQLSI